MMTETVIMNGLDIIIVIVILLVLTGHVWKVLLVQKRDIANPIQPNVLVRV